jgi:hypothetical protein
MCENDDNLDFKKSFATILFDDNPDYFKIYSMLEEDDEANIINYKKCGVDYLRRVIQKRIKTLIQILILRTTQAQHSEAEKNLTPEDKGFFKECRREVADRTQFNRGCLLFMKKADIPFNLVIEAFGKLPIEHRVISVKHAMGQVDPIYAIKSFNKTLENGYTKTIIDKVQFGLDEASFKEVDKRFKMNKEKINNASAMLLQLKVEPSVSMLEKFGIESFGVCDVLQLK